MSETLKTTGRRTAAVLALALGALAARAQEAPATVAVLIDTSGSLTPAALAQARGLATGLLERLPSRSELAVFSFDDQPRLLQPRTARPEEIAQALDKARIAGRFTTLYDALYDASRYLRDASRGRRAIVLVTDGRDENSALNVDDALRVAEDDGIPVFAVGVGQVEERVLRRIAKLTGGEYFPAASAAPAELAARVAALPARPPREPAAAATPAVPAVPPATAGAAPARPPSPAPAGSFLERHRLGLMLAVVLVQALVALVSLLSARRGGPRRCPSCGRELAGPLAECAFCAGTTRPPLRPAPARPAGAPPDESRTRPVPAVSDTVLARVESTEEYLEKTVTLREKPVLAVTAGPGAGRSVDLSYDTATSLGRSKANDVVLEDVAVSGQHCRVRPEDGRFVLHDLGSTNGTFVNDRRVTHQALDEGDVIQIGETRLTFRMERQRQ